MTLNELDGVVAVVVTFRRERLATQVVRGLIENEGFEPCAVIVVVNGDGGLDDHDLESDVSMVRLERNLGPAGGFEIGLQVAHEAGARWAYLCEDDVGLFDLPTPRVARILGDLPSGVDQPDRVGGVVAYGRTLDQRTGRTRPFVPGPKDGPYPVVDVAAWGASLVRCSCVDAGVLPDRDMFFGYEDFDFWLRMRRSGFEVVLDSATARAASSRIDGKHRDESLSGERPIDDEEPWRRFYEARNFMTLRRRFGNAGWTFAHLFLTARRAQLSPTWAHRRAALLGLIDGLRGRSGRDERFQRVVGERPDAG